MNWLKWCVGLLMHKPRGNTVIVLMLIFALALGLRLYGINWDQGNFFHPDERSIYMRVDCMHRVLTEAPLYRQDCMREFPQMESGIPGAGAFFSSERSPLNPHWFPLGSIIIYALLIVKIAFSPVWIMNMGDLALVGRTMSAAADTGSIFLIYMLGRRLYGSRVGVMAAFLMAVAVTHIQHSHFYRPETFLVLFTLASFLFMMRVIHGGRLRDSLLLGIFVGLTFTTKVSSLPLLIPLTITYVYCMVQPHSAFAGINRRKRVWCVIRHASAGGLVAAGVFLCWMPYALIDVHQFIGDTVAEAKIARTAGIRPYTLQYIGTIPVLYELRQTTVWALGIPLGLLAWGGLVFAALRSLWRRRIGEILLLTWCIPFFLILVPFEVKFLRYMFPLMPLLILLGSRLMVSTWDWTRWNAPRLTPIAIGVIVFVLLATAFYAFAFESVYRRAHPAVQASSWLNTNASLGARIITDNHWDEGIPDLGRFRVIQTPMYETDTFVKMRNLAATLAGGDYLVIYSNRLYGSITRVPDRYPASSQYYELLFSGELGYQLEKAFTTYPRFGGLTFVNDTFTRPGLAVPEALKEHDFMAPVILDLGYADENVMNYDHPLVLVFRNVRHQSATELTSMLTRPLLPGYLDRHVGLMLTQDDLQTQRMGGTWRTLFAPHGLSSKYPLLIWLLVVEVIAIAALPLTVMICRFLPDRGLLLARPLGILIVAYLVWIGASLNWIDFHRAAIIAAILIVTSVSAVVCLMRRHVLMQFIRAHWQYMAITEVLFLVAFTGFLVIRLANPDLWHPFRGGEKPMDFAYLNAVIKSTTIPPYDPWFAGGYLNYYYYGQFIVATLVKVTGIIPAVAYNLAIPLLFAITATGVFTVTYNLTEALRRCRYPNTSRKGPILAGVASMLLVVAIGNLDGAIQIVQGAWAVIVRGDVFPMFDFWRSSRMIHGEISITEFPLWSFLFADLHAHVISMPFMLLALGLGLNLALSGRGHQPIIGRGARLLAMALTVGAFAAINTWDFPTYIGIGVGVIAISVASEFRGSGRRGFLLLGGQAIVFVGLAFLMFLPYHNLWENFYRGVNVSQWQTSFHDYLAIHGLFFTLVLIFLAVEIRRHFKWCFWPSEGMELSSQNTGTSVWVKLSQGPARLVFFVVPAVVVIGALAVIGYATVGVLLVMLAVCVSLAICRMGKAGPETPLHLYVLLLLGFVFAIGAGVDLVTPAGDIDRMNTVFKFYLQAWILYALVGAFAAWYVVVSGALRPLRKLLVLKIGVLALLGVLCIGVSIYPFLGTRDRLVDRFEVLPMTLNGTAFMEKAVYRDEDRPIDLKWDAQAIQWMQENIDGSPVILEAVKTQYRWSGRVSIYTGLPAVLGWPWHQTQQRGRYSWAVDQRKRDVEEIYSTVDVDEAMRLLNKYDVSYIYVGPVERLYYQELGLDKFDEMAGNDLEVVYHNQEVTVYYLSGETTSL